MLGSQVKQTMQNRETSQVQRALMDITAMLVCTEDDLSKLGLHLGYGQGQITQYRTNSQRSIQHAAYLLTCDWWETSSLHQDQKFAIAQTLAEEIGKRNLNEDVQLILRQVKVRVRGNATANAVQQN